MTNGIVDTTTAHGQLVFGMFALMAEYETGLNQERTQAGLAARSRGHKGGRKPQMTASLIGKAQGMYDARQFTMAEIATSCGNDSRVIGGDHANPLAGHQLRPIGGSQPFPGILRLAHGVGTVGLVSP